MTARRYIISSTPISPEVGHIHCRRREKGYISVEHADLDMYATITDPMSPNLLLGGSRYVDEYGVGKEPGPPPASMDVRAHHPKTVQMRLERTTAYARGVSI